MVMPGLCAWLVIAFDSYTHDPRDYLLTEFDGLTLHIQPGHDDRVSLIAVFLDNPAESLNVQIKVNRFLSAMSWKDGEAFATLGALQSGARSEDRDKPRFNWGEPRVFRGGVISRFDFEHLQCPREQKQQLALALYREGFNSIAPFYRLLSFYKIINIGFRTGPEQVSWINANLDKIWNHWSKERVVKLSSSIADIGQYLFKQGRNAVAHAFAHPIRNPDDPSDFFVVRDDATLMQGLAEVFIEQELGVPSIRKIWREHLFELVGFRALFGDALTIKLKTREDVAIADFPTIPSLTLALKERPPYYSLIGIPFRVAACHAGVVTLVSDTTTQPIHAALVLNFPDETLQFVLPAFGIMRTHVAYIKSAEVDCWQFLIDYFCNGFLQVFDSTTRERLSYKLAFVAVNIDLGRTIDGWKKIIEGLEANE